MKETLNKEADDRPKGYTTLPHVRGAVVTSDADLEDNELWQKEIPYDVRQLAVKQLLAAYKTCFTQHKNKTITNFNVSYKSKKDPTQVFYCPKKCFNLKTLSIFPRRLKKNKTLRIRKKCLRSFHRALGDASIQDFVVIRNNGAWYLCLPYKKQESAHTIAPYQHVFLDPGVRTFQTYYSPEGVCGKLGEQYATSQIKPLLQKVDALQSVQDRKKQLCFRTKTISHLKKRASLLRTKIKNKVRDLHWKTASMLTDNFQSIHIPIFETKPMSITTKRNINRSTVRSMQTLSHYTFRQRLEHLCHVKNRTLVVVHEEYTSITCGRCGVKNDGLGGNPVFCCNVCDFGPIDRDLHAARNICLKYITETCNH